MKLAWSVGHDPMHPGAVSGPLGEKEHDIAREVVELGKKMIKALSLGWDVFTPEVDPMGKSAGAVLQEKIRLINGWGADVALESHFNSAADPRASGCETLYFSLPIGGRFSVEGKRLAELIQESTIGVLNRAPMRLPRPALKIRDRGAKGMADLRRVYNGVETIPRYAFLTQTKMPALILEPLFISSPTDTALLKSDRKLEIHRLAMAVVTSLVKWNVEKSAN